MITWIVRTLLLLAGAITSWFVAPDAANFDVVQGIFAVALLAVFLLLAVFGPSVIRVLANKSTG
jgi:hypothetical protein